MSGEIIRGDFFRDKVSNEAIDLCKQAVGIQMPSHETSGVRTIPPGTPMMVSIFSRSETPEVGEIARLEAERWNSLLAGVHWFYFTTGWRTAAFIHADAGRAAVGFRNAKDFEDVAKECRKCLPYEVTIVIAVGPQHKGIGRDGGSSDQDSDRDRVGR